METTSIFGENSDVNLSTRTVSELNDDYTSNSGIRGSRNSGFLNSWYPVFI